MAVINENLLIIGQSKTSQTERLTNFYKKKYSYLLSISFESIFKKNLEIRVNEYTYGNIIHSYKTILNNSKPKNELFILFNFIKLFFKIILIILNNKKKFQISIGIALFSAAICMITKVFKKTDKFVYFFLDYYEPTGGIVNFIYNYIA